MAMLAKNIGQLIMVGFEEHSPPPHVLERLASGQIGGVYLFGRNAHMETAQLALAQVICGRARAAILICARNPYDASLIEGADSVICANGDSGPSLEAAVDAIFGDYRPGGRLTVEI